MAWSRSLQKKKKRDKTPFFHFIGSLGNSRKREFMDPKQRILLESSSPFSLPGWFEIFGIYLTFLDMIFTCFFPWNENFSCFFSMERAGSRWGKPTCVCLSITWSSQERNSLESGRIQALLPRIFGVWVLELGLGWEQSMDLGWVVGFLGITELGKEQGWRQGGIQGFPGVIPALLQQWEDGMMERGHWKKGNIPSVSLWDWCPTSWEGQAPSQSICPWNFTLESSPGGSITQKPQHRKPQYRKPKSSSCPIQVFSTNPARNAQRKTKQGRGKKLPKFWKAPI